MKSDSERLQGERSSERSQGSRALERGLGILGLFSSQQTSLSVKEISRQLKVPIATTYRLVRSLVEKGYLEDHRDAKGHVRLGLEILRLAAIANAGNDILTVGGEILRKLTLSTGETGVLLVPGEWTATCVGMTEGTSAIRPRSVRVGESVPYNAGAIPLTLLAYADSEFRNRIVAAELQRYTRSTPADPAVIEQLCARIRAQGYAHSESEYVQGTAASAAPIFDAQGKIIGAIGVTGISENVRGTEPAVQEAATTVTLRLGGRPVMLQP